MEDFKTPTRQDAIQAFQSDKLLRNGLILIVFAVLFFAFAGALAGWALGAFAPDYYRIHLHFDKGEADAGQIGIGLVRDPRCDSRFDRRLRRGLDDRLVQVCASKASSSINWTIERVGYRSPS